MSQTKIMKPNAKQHHKRENSDLTDEEVIEIKKKDLLDYAEKMTSVKDMHKKRSIDFNNWG